MIVGNLKDISRYKLLSKNLAIAIDYIEAKGLAGLQNLPLGRNEVSGDDVFVMREDFPLHERDNNLWEVHRNYMDIHIRFDSDEIIAFLLNADNTKVAVPYDSKKDYEFLTSDDYKNQVLLNKDMFAIIHSHTLHQPNIRAGASEKVSKVIFKVLQ